VGDEEPSHSVNHEAHRPAGAPRNGTAAQPSHRYEVGPGFEIAIRAALNRPVEVTVVKDGEGEKPPRKSGDSDHRHETAEKRLEAVERALLMLVDHMKNIEDEIARGKRPA